MFMPEQVRLKLKSFTPSSSSLGSCCRGGAPPIPPAWPGCSREPGVGGGSLLNHMSFPHCESNIGWQPSLSLSQLDVTNSLPMTSPARYSVPASFEQAEDRARGDCSGEKGFFLQKQGNNFPSSLHHRATQICHRAIPASRLPAAVLGCVSDALSILGGGCNAGNSAPLLSSRGCR